MKGIGKFQDAKLESEFRAEYTEDFNRNIQNVYKALVPFMALFTVVEYWLRPEGYGYKVLLFIFLPALLLFLFLSHWQPFLRLVWGKAQMHASWLAVLLIGGIEYLLSVNVDQYYAVGKNHPVLIYVIVVYSILRFQLFWATVTAVLISASTVVFQLLSPHSLNGRLLATLVVANVIGMWIAARLESGTRQDFLDRREAEAAAAKLKGMLANVIPPDVAERLKSSSADHLHYQQPVEDLAVLFSDLSGFTAFARQVSPATLIRALNRINSLFDAEADRLGLTKIKTLGDAAVYVSGLTGRPDPDGLKEMGRAMLVRLADANRELGTELKIRIGLGRGRATCGVIGKLRVKFDVWGEAIEAAERHQKAAEPGEIRFDERLDATA